MFDLYLPPSKQSLFRSIDLLKDSSLALGRDGGGRAEADVVTGDGIEGRIHVTERNPAQQGLLPPVLGDP